MRVRFPLPAPAHLRTDGCKADVPDDHPIFRDNPITGSVGLRTGTAPTPYHVHDGEALLIFGDISTAAVAAVIEGDDVHLVETRSGRAAAGMIMADFRDASMGPHHELQFFVLVADQPGATIGELPLALPIAMASPDYATLCFKLWNDVDAVLAYNNDYLGLNASAAAFRLFQQQGDGSTAFSIVDAGGEPLLRGRFAPHKRTRVSAMWEMLKIAGWRRLMALGRARYTEGAVVNRRSAVMPNNRKAPIFTDAGHNVARLWDSATDQLEIGGEEIDGLDFEPRALQHLWPFRFVYRHPDDSA